MAEASTNTWSLAGLKNAILSGDKDNVSQEEKTQAAIHAAVREETKLKEERGESTSGWRSKINSLLDDDNSIKEEIKKLEAELAELKADEADDTWTEKISARFDGSREARTAKITELEAKLADAKKREAEKQEGWKGKLQDVFDGEDDEGKERLKAEVNKNASWKDKLGDQFFGAPKEEVKEEGFSLSGKLNELAGGGHKSEAKEDKLDKLVDLYQEHVMKAGPQNNESAVEQAKDEQISDAIRRGFKMATGRDIPVSDKAH
ncbi:hypothetical protein BDV93DRAFT_501730 [Ceratobasidium sp. AG-I]|nr:hypothetical protein BDV93DRAFT_501730 [Ceratobasidium sp. AG-I]